MATVQSDSFSSETRGLLNLSQLVHLNPHSYLQSLTKRMLEIENEMLALGLQRNPCVPVNRLPPDVLARTFLMLRALFSPFGPDMSWIWVTHVCFHWRSVAIGCPELWSEIPSIAQKRPGLLDALIDRSKSALLSVDLEIESSDTDVSMALSHMGRIQCLRVEDAILDDDPENDTCSKLLSDQSAPKLERLQLMGHHRRPRMLRSKLFQGGCPSLVSLDVYMYKITDCKSLPLVPSLRNLHLSMPYPYLTCPRPTPGDFISCLGAMKDLETIYISGYLPHDAQQESIAGPSSVAVLPRLQSLRLCDTTDSLATFIQRIRYPEATNIGLVSCTLPDGDNINRLLGALQASWGLDEIEPGDTSSSSKMPFAVDAMRLSRYRVDSTSGSVSIPKLEVESTKNGQKQLTISHQMADLVEGSQWSLLEFLRDIGAQIDLSPLKRLTIDSPSPMEDGVWESFFASLVKLEHIVLENTPASDFLSWICNDSRARRASVYGIAQSQEAECHSNASSGPADCTSDLVVFPNLRVLHLDGVSGMEGEGQGAEGLGMEDALAAALELRSLASRPIQEVHLEYCDWVTEDGYQRLKNASPTSMISWDRWRPPARRLGAVE